MEVDALSSVNFFYRELMLVIAIFFRDVITILQVPSVKGVELVFMAMPHKELLKIVSHVHVL